ncbi:MAG: hypothetical protein V2I40_03945 [Desulfobacteraceae bacterium]|jgi:hypothetical protein|nr:hypothetical protein [Desulfobacteraceae bacterium]
MKKKRLFCACLALPVVIFISPFVMAGMSSLNYRIPTTVMSGGGGPMASTDYGMTGTVGQPSPLNDDPLFPPFSDNYEMLTGFWYTLAAGGGCTYDHDTDRDVDGVDLAEFIDPFDFAKLPSFALEFGRTDCF